MRSRLNPVQATPSRLPTLLCAGAAVLLAAVAMPGARAATVPWSEEPLSYTVVDQELRDLLVEVGGRLGVRVRVSDQVRGRVRGRLPPAPPQEFLSRLAAIHGFEWFYDGGILWISAQSESQTRMLQLEQVTLDQVTTAMDELGASDPRWPLRGSGQAGVVMVNGPPRYVAMAEQTLQALQARMKPVRNGGVLVFRGS